MRATFASVHFWLSWNGYLIFTPIAFFVQNKYHIKLFVPGSEGGDSLEEIVVKCETELQYAQWMAAFRLASKGTIQDCFDWWLSRIRWRNWIGYDPGLDSRSDTIEDFIRDRTRLRIGSGLPTGQPGKDPTLDVSGQSSIAFTNFFHFDGIQAKRWRTRPTSPRYNRSKRFSPCSIPLPGLPPLDRVTLVCPFSGCPIFATVWHLCVSLFVRLFIYVHVSVCLSALSFSNYLSNIHLSISLSVSAITLSAYVFRWKWRRGQVFTQRDPPRGLYSLQAFKEAQTQSHCH